ncbi:hypothetical protein Tsubulata_019367 [Turnera subulata]|uniref:Peptidase S54 rhomboid domain-containing protein n=1 Tax=Turnera subulata TaxID=218843 RepID=A0A9Q0GIB2_9ROSI|nr:hypothetical protein Tsubulata_019367 [Turnera subulata]
MAVVSICCKMPYKDLGIPPQNLARHHDGGVLCNCSAFAQGSRFFLSISSGLSHRCRILHAIPEVLLKRKAGRVKACKGAIHNHGALFFHNTAEKPILRMFGDKNGKNLCVVCHASDSSTNENQLNLLDSYFRKIDVDGNRPSSDSCNEMSAEQERNGELNAKGELEYLDAYLGKLSKDTNADDSMSSTFGAQITEEGLESRTSSVSKGSIKDNGEKLRGFKKLRNRTLDRDSGSFEAFQQNDEASDLYLIGLLASINIGVFLFEIASPIQSSEFQLFSLPLLYGAKINDLILVGEWWRLVTPMFLVCRGYGSFTFFLIYVLGGISGNLTSFLHTAEPSIGGTGPIFAVIGAWLIYQSQNRDGIQKDVSDSLFQKAIITTGLCFILSHFGPIDDWTHLGAVLSGIVYGYFTCPTLQLDDASSSAGQDEGVALVGRYANPCKSLIIFTIFVIFLSSLLFLVEPPLDTVMPDDLI